MTQAMVNHYNHYRQRIQFLRSSGDILLQQIKTLETNMNRRKQQNQQPNINLLNAMTKKLLQMLAEISTCQYFQLTNEPFDFHSSYFVRMCNRYFEDLTQQFITKLRIGRIQRLQNLQHLQHLQHLQSSLEDVIHPIDFQIVQ